jgi:4-hydroxyproline epimerase
VAGDVAWGGNWFFLAGDPPLALIRENADELVELAWRVRLAANAAGFPGVDHVEWFGPARGGGDSRNFVLCPGKAYDRSPCGTGTSAKLACLAADGLLAEGAEWRQEGILGCEFSASFRWLDRAAGTILPSITGRAHLTARATLFAEPDDPFAAGIPATPQAP